MSFRPKRPLLRILLALLGLYGLWLGYQWRRYRPLPVEPANHDPLEIVGAYHIHTRDSDGSRTPDAVARIAAGLGLDFIILTDHGNPNPAASSQGRWEGPLLVLAGTELSVNRGHLVALGYDPPPPAFSSIAEEAARQVQLRDGLTIIAHPYSKTRWSWGEYAGYRGIEIVSTDVMLRKNWPTLLPALPLLLLNPRIPLVRILEDPERSLRRWDELCRQHQVHAYFSCDAHLLYRPTLSLLHLHVLLTSPLQRDYRQARDQVFSALRDGRFFNCVAAAAPGRGFRFWAEDGRGRIPMGASTPYAATLRLHIDTPPAFSAEWRLLRSGEPLLASQEKSLTVDPEGPGAYRVEVYLREKSPLPGSCPWILSNPIFLKETSR